jgi:hypothetical protein
MPFCLSFRKMQCFAYKIFWFGKKEKESASGEETTLFAQKNYE